jgi:hypothetical protein
MSHGQQDRAIPRGTRPKDVDMILELIWPLNEARESGDVHPATKRLLPRTLMRLEKALGPVFQSLFR